MTLAALTCINGRHRQAATAGVTPIWSIPRVELTHAGGIRRWQFERYRTATTPEFLSRYLQSGRAMLVTDKQGSRCGCLCDEWISGSLA